MSTELFSLSMGKMEDQIDLFQFENAMVERTNSVTMRDGWFYVANASAGKIMVFSSYGDLIFLLYNPQTNPAPTILGPVDTNGAHELGCPRCTTPRASACAIRLRRCGEHAGVRGLSLLGHRENRRCQRPHPVRGRRRLRGKGSEGHGPRSDPQPGDPALRSEGAAAGISRAKKGSAGRHSRSCLPST